MSSVTPAFGFANIHFVLKAGRQTVWGYIFWQGCGCFYGCCLREDLSNLSKQMRMWHGGIGSWTPGRLADAHSRWTTPLLLLGGPSRFPSNPGLGVGRMSRPAGSAVDQSLDFVSLQKSQCKKGLSGHGNYFENPWYALNAGRVLKWKVQIHLKKEYACFAKLRPREYFPLLQFQVSFSSCCQMGNLPSPFQRLANESCRNQRFLSPPVLLKIVYVASQAGPGSRF